MTRLLDVNALLALAWPEHESHLPVTQWFTALQEDWATCPLVECGFIRVSMNWPARPEKIAASDAQAALRQLRVTKNHRFLPEDISPVEINLAAVQGHNQVTDAYLIAIAQKYNAVIATLDSRMRTLAHGSPVIDVIPH